jgi:alkylated DNA nucleotide flippase Atl1
LVVARSGRLPAGDPEEYAERVLAVVERIPPGRVMTYGDIAEYLGRGGPRQVGAVLSRDGGSVPWWRVVTATGRLPPGHELRAAEALRAEGVPLRGDHLAPRADLRAARWDGQDRATPGRNR